MKLDDMARCPCGNWSKWIFMNHQTGEWHCDKCDGSKKGSTISTEWKAEQLTYHDFEELSTDVLCLIANIIGKILREREMEPAEDKNHSGITK